VVTYQGASSAARAGGSSLRGWGGEAADNTWANHLKCGGGGRPGGKRSEAERSKESLYRACYVKKKEGRSYRVRKGFKRRPGRRSGRGSEGGGKMFSMMLLQGSRTCPKKGGKSDVKNALARQIERGSWGESARLRGGTIETASLQEGDGLKRVSRSSETGVQPSLPGKKNVRSGFRAEQNPQDATLNVP